MAAVAALWHWWPGISGWAQHRVSTKNPRHDEHSHEDEESDHAHHGKENHDTGSLELSQQARMNLGLTPASVRPVELRTFWKTITVPAIVVGRPGRTNIKVSTPLTGVIEHVHAVTGEAVEPGSLLFEIRLTHEDLVQSQTDFLKSLEELDVEEREIQRLKEISESGAVAGKTLLERHYAKGKLEAILKAQREALRLHGLSERQIEMIVRDRHLLRELQITVPSPDAHGKDEELRLTERPSYPVVFQDTASSADQSSKQSVPLVIDELDVQKGQSVSAGEELCTLADYTRLYIEGQAFEQDTRALNRAMQNDWTLTAIFSDDEGQYEQNGLTMAYLGHSIDPISRTQSFFVDLPNQIIRDQKNGEGQRFISWKYRVGQRLELQVPVEEWLQQIVVPVEALARDGAETYVFQENGDRFERIAVRVIYRDRQSAVIANDGSLFPGDVIAMRGAHQLQMALKNQASGPVDPHAGHHH
jgi:multidrug efflux pump subunit AcrA (membrane-fusion protein)